MAPTRIPLTLLNPNGNGVTVGLTDVGADGNVFRNDGHTVLIAMTGGVHPAEPVVFPPVTLNGVPDPYARDGVSEYTFTDYDQVAIFGPFSVDAFNAADGDIDITATGSVPPRFFAFHITP